MHLSTAVLTNGIDCDEKKIDVIFIATESHYSCSKMRVVAFIMYLVKMWLMIFRSFNDGHHFLMSVYCTFVCHVLQL